MGFEWLSTERTNSVETLLKGKNRVFMKIKELEVGTLFLAPMAGVTDVAFRSMCRDAGATFSTTEMVNAKGLLHNSKRTEHLLFSLDNETPKAVQLFGNDPEVLAKACRHPLLQKFDVIDLNMGCPAPKIVKNGEGSALMKNMPLAKKIIETCVAATDKPITVKFRKGYDENSVNAVEFAKMCEQAGASAITVHGRTKAQMYGGTADYEIIRAVKQAVKIPVIGNGDVRDRESYERMLATGADGVMIGRAAMGNPSVFSLFNTGETGKTENEAWRYEAAGKHLSLMRRFYPESFLSAYMRKHLLWYASGLPNTGNFKNKMATCASLDESLEILRSHCFPQSSQE